MLKTPVLFLVFNRPTHTKKVFEAIRAAKPEQLFVAADGSRETKEGEQQTCEIVRDIATNIDWDCELKTLFRDTNLGCKKAVSEAITWFFTQVEEGIILEDDCLPDPSFFAFCEELLQKYKTDERIMSISGSNLLGYPWKEDLHSYFWGIAGIWGWATWRRAWALYDINMTGWEDDEIKKRIKDASRTENFYNYYYHMLDAAYKNTLNTWDLQWVYSILINGGISAHPSVNLVQNIGFDNEGTHTNEGNELVEKLKLSSLNNPIIHPKHKIVDIEYMDLIYRTKVLVVKKISFVSFVKDILIKKIFF